MDIACIDSLLQANTDGPLLVMMPAYSYAMLCLGYLSGCVLCSARKSGKRKKLTVFNPT